MIKVYSLIKGSWVLWEVVPRASHYGMKAVQACL